VTRKSHVICPLLMTWRAFLDCAKGETMTAEVASAKVYEFSPSSPRHELSSTSVKLMANGQMPTGMDTSSL